MPNGLFGKSVVNSTAPVRIATTPSNKLRTANINVLATASTAIDIAITDYTFQNADFERWNNVYAIAAMESFRVGKVSVEDGDTVIHPRVYGVPDTTAGAGVLNDTTKNYFYTTDGITFTRIANSVEYVRHETSGAWYYCTPDGQRRTWSQFKSMTAGTSGTSYTNNNWTHIVRAGTATDQQGAILFKRGFTNVQYSTNMRTAGAFSWSTAYTVTQGGSIEHIVWLPGTTRYYLGMSSALIHYATAAPTLATSWNNSYITMPAGHASKLRGGTRFNGVDVLWFDDNKIATGADNTATFTYLTTWPSEITNPATQVVRIEASDDNAGLYVYCKNGDVFYTTNLTTWDKRAARNAQTTAIKTGIEVTVASSKFNMNGVSAPSLRLKRGFTYYFYQGHASNSGNTIAFTDENGNAYTTGVTSTGTPGTPGAFTTLVVAATAPATLLYKSVANGTSYGGSFSVVDDIVTSGAITTSNSKVVTVVSNEFWIDGVQKPALTFIKGYTYVFDVSAASNSGKVFSFRDSSNAAFTTGVTTTGTPGTAGANVTFVVPDTATDTMTYLDATIGTSSGASITVYENNVIASFDNYSSSVLNQMVSLTASGKIWSRERQFFDIPANSYIEKGVLLSAAQVLERTTVMVGPNEQVIVKSSANGTVVRMYGIEE